MINIALGLASFFGGIWVRGLSDSLVELKKADAVLAEKVQTIEVLVVGEYPKRAELDKLSIAIFSKLDRIENMIYSKADKQ